MPPSLRLRAVVVEDALDPAPALLAVGQLARIAASLIGMLIW